MDDKDIQRVHFFDGQFLKEAEFNGLSEYMVHMRRRMLFMLFEKSGVVQVGDRPLEIEPEGGGSKRIRVKAGTALGMRPDAVEAKEIILATDVASIDLSVASDKVPVALRAGNTGIVTIHYAEQQLADPRPAGDPGISRIREKAVITVHVNQLTALNADNGEPFVRLGDVIFDSMQVDYKYRDKALLRPTLIAQTRSISVDKTEVTAGQEVILTVTSFGDFSLSGVTQSNVSIDPSVGQFSVLGTPQATSMQLKINPPRDTTPGKKTLTITVGNIPVQTSFLVQAALTITGFERATTDNPLFTINGSGFQVPTTVQFATASGLTGPIDFAVASFTQMTCFINKIPADAISGKVSVKSAGRDATSDNPVVPPPEISTAQVSVTSGAGGVLINTLTVTGKRLFPGAGATKVAFVRDDGTPVAQLGTPTSTSGVLTVSAPSTTGSPVRVLITTDGGAAKSPGTVSVA